MSPLPPPPKPWVVEASLFDEDMNPRVLYSSSTCALARAVSALHSRKVYPSALTRCTHGHQKKYGSRCFLSHGVGIRTWSQEEYESDASAQKLHRTLAQKVETKSELKQRKKEEGETRAKFFDAERPSAPAAAPAVITV
jgi:hypothetical protein